MKKMIFRTYDNSTIKGIDQGDKEHMRLLNLGYNVSHTNSGLFTSHYTYTKP